MWSNYPFYNQIIKKLNKLLINQIIKLHYHLVMRSILVSIITKCKSYNTQARDDEGFFFFSIKNSLHKNYFTKN